MRFYSVVAAIGTRRDRGPEGRISAVYAAHRLRGPFGFDGHGAFHLDCRRPQDLSHEERALLFTYCWHYAAAGYATCGRGYRRLYADFLGARAAVCPGCRTDLTDRVRMHLFACALIPSEVRWRAAQAREAAPQLVKQSQQLSDRADVLMRQAEAAIAALREGCGVQPFKSNLRSREQRSSAARTDGDEELGDLDEQRTGGPRGNSGE
jgi:hypothetical protein